MTGLSAANLSSFKYAGFNSAQAAKTYAKTAGAALPKTASDAQSTSSAWNIKDELILSQQERTTYAKHIGKPNKTKQSVPATQTQDIAVTEPSRIFSTAPESVNNLIQFLGLGTINTNDATLAGALNLSLETETQELTDILNGLIQEAGLDDETDDITFYKNVRTGNISVSGHFDDHNKQEYLAELINSDPELVERLKNHMVKLEIARTLENDVDISTDEFASARKQLLESFLLREGGFSLSDVAVNTDPDTGIKSLIQIDADGNEVADSLLSSLLSKIPGLETELLHLLESPTTRPEAPRTVLAMNSGEMRSWQAFSHYIEELGGYISVLSEGGETTPFLFFDASALEAYMGEFQLYEPIHLEGRKPMEFVADVLERHSNHVCLRLWAVGVDIAGKSRQAVNAMYRDSNLTATLSAQVQANIKKINEKITGILESNSIILGANETLNFTVNQRREIIVGDGVSADKREQIEKLLNADKTLAQELLYSHAERRVATNSSPINTSLSTQSCDENMVFHWMISNYPNSEWIPMHLIGDLAIL